MRALLLVVSVSVSLGVGLAAAQPGAAEPEGAAVDEGQISKKERIERLAQTAAEHYAAGRFREAIAAYKEAYDIEPFGPVLYNIAYIYDRELDDPALAQDYYRRYVNAPDAEAETRVTAFERLQVIDDRLRRRALAEPGPPPVVHTGASTQRVAGWTVLGVGLATAAAGGAFAVLAATTHGDFEDTDDALERGRLRDDGRQQALVGDIALGVGGAAVITGLVLLLTDSEPETAPTVSVEADGDAALWWRGTW